MNVVRALPPAMAALLPPGLNAGLDLLGRAEIMKMLPLLSAELLGEGTIATRLVLPSHW